MKIKCRYCRSYISDTDERCPNCGAVNEDLKRVGDGVPTTIEELKKWYIDHNLPDEEITRFFIGKDYKEPKAFGIYYDELNGNYVVYKNKDTGERKIRYEGRDEKYAVNELYLRLKEEISNQKEHNKNSSGPFGVLFLIHFFSVFVVGFITMPLNFNIIPFLFMFLSVNPGVFIMLPILLVIKNEKKRRIVDAIWHILSFIICFILIIIFIVIPLLIHKNDAYYKYNDKIYYNYGNDWYYYNHDTWENYNGNTENFDYINDDYQTDMNASDFKDSKYYEDSSWSSSSSSSSNDWDSGSSWSSSDSWDSGGSDWSSDW